jgi:hypothetical protein
MAKTSSKTGANPAVNSLGRFSSSGCDLDIIGLTRQNISITFVPRIDP